MSEFKSEDLNKDKAWNQRSEDPRDQKMDRDPSTVTSQAWLTPGKLLAGDVNDLLFLFLNYLYTTIFHNT